MEAAYSFNVASFLKRCRARIHPESRSLGGVLRRPKRIGKAVTQEEVAEAVGISRPWYARMESDRTMRVSAALLARIADVLMMEPAQRVSLFQLALPELRSTSLTDDSIAMLEAFGWLRHLMQRLWAANTEAEGLTLIREYAMAQLAPDLMATRTRVEENFWHFAAIGDAYTDDRMKQFQELVRARWGPAVLDDAHGYALMVQPGEVMTRAERDARLPDLAAKVRQALDAMGWAGVSFAMANIRSQRGLVARLMAVHNSPHDFSEVELAQLSTLATLASLALSGRASSLRVSVGEF